MQNTVILFSYKTEVATSVAEFDLVKKCQFLVSVIVRSSLEFFPAHQHVATNSMHLPFTYLHLTFTAPFQSVAHLESS